jgi:hypothetical protein
MEPSQELCDRLFKYEDGILYWKDHFNSDKPHWKVVIGNRAGCLVGNGYWYVTIGGKRYKAARIIFLMHHGYLPEIVDHIDGNPVNDNIDNLRAATRITNNWNRKSSSNNTSGVPGLTFNKEKNKWQVRIEANYKVYHIGYFTYKSEAENVVRNVRKILHGNFVRNDS